MTPWQHGYADAYTYPQWRGMPRRPQCADYMNGFLCGQEEWRKATLGVDYLTHERK